MQVTLIHNPDAGTEDQPAAKELRRLIRRAGHSVVYKSAHDEGWAAALQEPGDLIAVAGGDGMVGRVAKAALGGRVPIAVLPLGTANNVARALKVAEKPLDRLIESWGTAPRVEFDVGIAAGPWGSTLFIEGVGIGPFAEIMSRLDSRGNIDLAGLPSASEKVASVQEFLKSRLHDYPPHSFKLLLDGEDLSGEYVVLEILNIRSIGPNLCLAPGADPGDRRFDVVHVRQGDLDSLIHYLAESSTGRASAPRLPVRRCENLRIELQGLPIHIDDEVWPPAAAIHGSGPVEVSLKLHAERLLFLAAEKDT